MKKHLFTAAICLIISTISFAQKAYQKISIQGSLDVQIEQADGKLTVSADEDLTVEESGNTITVMNGAGDGKSVTISTSNLKEIEIGGTVVVTKISDLNFTNIIISIEGSCNTPVHLVCTTAKLILGGTTNLLISGSAATTDITLTGANDIDARNFIVDAATLKIEGSNTTWINAKKSLKVNATGACIINYKTYLIASKPKKKYLPFVSKKLTGACVIKGY
jgi:Putative auto-transporter adhesin, head GIN domain